MTVDTHSRKFNKVRQWSISQRMGHFRWRSVLWVITGLVLISGPRVTDLGEFVAFDEPLYWAWTNQFFAAIVAGDWADTLVGRGNPGIIILVIQSFGLGLRYLLSLLAGDTGVQALAHLHIDQPGIVFSELAVRRLPMALFNVLAVLILISLIYRQFGWRITVLSTIFLSLDPFLLSDSRTMRGDALMSVLMTVSAISLVIYLTEDNWRYLLLSGFAAAWSFSNKLSTLAMAPFVLLLVGVYIFRQAQQIGWRRGLRAGLFCSATWAGILLVWLWLIWPALWVVPIDVFTLLVNFVASTGLEGRLNFFMGQVFTNEPLPFFYILIILLKISPLVLIGLFSGLFSFGSRTRRLALFEAWRIRKMSLQTKQIVTGEALLIYALSVWLVMTIGIFKREHYVMPTFPALDILGAVGLSWLGSKLVDRISLNRLRRRSVSLGIVGLIFIIVVQAAVSLPHHPYYYSYFNPLILGPLWAHRVTLINWGPDMGEAAHFINAQPNASTAIVATSTARKLAPQIQGETVRLVYGDPWIQADYFVIPYEDVQFPKINPSYYDYVRRQPVLYQINLRGVPFGWVYQGTAVENFAGSKLDGLGLLLGYNLDTSPLSAGKVRPLKLFWQNDGYGKNDLLFVRLVDAGGYIWTEAFPIPLAGYEVDALTDEAIVESQAELEVPLGTPPGDYFLSVGFRSAKTGEVRGTFQLPAGADRLTVTRPQTPPSVTNLAIDHPVKIQATPDIGLLGYSLPDDILSHAQTNWLTLFWQAETAPTKDYVMALQLLDVQGQEVAYWLGRPVMSGYPTTAWLAGELVRDPWQLQLPAELSPGDYTLQLTLFDTATEVEVSRMILGQVLVVTRRRQFTPPAIDHLVNSSLAGRTTLLGYDLLAEPITGGGRLRVTLYWQAQDTIEKSHTVFVQLLDANGVLVAQHDGLPANGTIPTNDWAAGEVIADQHLFEFADLLAGDYVVVAGMYDPTTGERLAAPNGDTAIRLETLSISQ